jgi:hypothetical protein
MLAERWHSSRCRYPANPRLSTTLRWIFELKLDGFRSLAVIQNGPASPMASVPLFSPHSLRFPTLPGLVVYALQSRATTLITLACEQPGREPEVSLGHPPDCVSATLRETLRMSRRAAS